MNDFRRAVATSLVLASLATLGLPGCTGCEKGITNTVAEDPPEAILAHAGEEDQSFPYTRMSTRYRGKHSLEEFTKKIKGIPHVKELNNASPASVKGSSDRRTIRGNIDLKDGKIVDWESVTVMEDEATNAWRCDSLKIGSYVID
jgi:hypothetical protein